MIYDDMPQAQMSPCQKLSIGKYAETQIQFPSYYNNVEM